MIKIGDKLWTRDPRDHRAKWESREISWETKQSWVLASGYSWIKPNKVNKKTMYENLGQWGHQKWYTEKDMKAHLFIQSCRHLIADRVRGEQDAKMLKQIADILGMNVGEP